MSDYISREAVNDLIKAECSPKVAAYLIDAVATIPAADAIEKLQKDVNFHKFNSEFWEGKFNSLADKKWIPVTERLPLYGQDVLAVRTYWDGEKCQEVLMAHIAVWNEETGKKWWNATNITHWMPLPEPPKEE